MTDRGVAAFLSNSVKFGADVGVAAGPVGAGMDASTANLSADILTYSRSKGLYGGISVEGAVVAVRNGWNQAYYGKGHPHGHPDPQGCQGEHAAKLVEVLSRPPAGMGQKRERALMAAHTFDLGNEHGPAPQNLGRAGTVSP
jgi:hypothetical protein